MYRLVGSGSDISVQGHIPNPSFLDRRSTRSVTLSFVDSILQNFDAARFTRDELASIVIRNRRLGGISWFKTFLVIEDDLACEILTEFESQFPTPDPNASVGPSASSTPTSKLYSVCAIPCFNIEFIIYV